MLRKIAPYFCLAVSIVLTSVSFLPCKSGFIIFFSIAPFFYALNSMGCTQRLFSGFLWGFSVSLASLFWINSVTTAGYFALCFYHGLFVLIFSMLWKIAADSFSRAVIWVSLDWLKENLFYGSPFANIAQPLADWPFLMQTASLGGILLTGFWIVLVNLLISGAFEKKQKAVTAMLVIIIPVIYGLMRVDTPESKFSQEIKSVTFGIVQPYITPDIKWNPSADDMQILLETSMGFRSCEIDILVWPETAMVSDFRRNEDRLKKIQDMLEKLGCSMLLGSPDEEHDNRVYNSVFFIDKTAAVLDRYAKINLVPFGEYLPFEKFLPWVKLLTPIPFGFDRGEKLTLFCYNSLKFSPLICIEDCLSSFARKAAGQGAMMFITVTNDGWFPGVVGPRTHELLSRYRSVENGIPMLRCANTGISSFISKTGRQIQAVPEGIRGIMKASVLQENPVKTLFSVIGYSWIAFLMIPVLAVRLKTSFRC